MQNQSDITPIIKISNLTKSYNNQVVLKGITLNVYPGQIIGYIGPNGAGKSTTVRILSGIDADFQGTVEVDGLDVKKQALEVKRIIGYVPENAELYEVLTPGEFLNFVGRLYDLPEERLNRRIQEMMTFFNMSAHVDQRMETFSKGMRQKVLLISGLLHDPRILFLDEPLAGLDANSVILVKEMLARMAAAGKTIFYSSHMMDVVEKISDRIILIHQGNIVVDGDFESLKKESSDSLEKIFAQLTGDQGVDALMDSFIKAFDQSKEEGE